MSAIPMKAMSYPGPVILNAAWTDSTGFLSFLPAL